MLDPKGRADVMNIISMLKKRGDVTVVLITHHMDEAAAADRVVVMNEGEIVMDGTPREVFVRVEELKELGLSVPDTTELMYELNKEGFNLSLSALTVEECADEIKKALNL
jgi:energy-coupling factor transport system ATP-binding protein